MAVNGPGRPYLGRHSPGLCGTCSLPLLRLPSTYNRASQTCHDATLAQVLAACVMQRLRPGHAAML